MNRLRTVLVTGGGRRIGAVIARDLAVRGYRVALHQHHATGDADALAATLPGAAVVTGDLAEPGQAARLIQDARLAFGAPLDAVVNNASRFEFDRPPIDETGSIDAHMAVNLTAPVMLASALARQDDVPRGAVVNLLDQKIANLNPDFFSYSCSRVALEGATVMLAQALGPRIRVNAVAPGLTLPSLDQSEEEFRAVACENLLRRPVDPAAIAGAVAFLVEARGISGQTLFVDNGQRFLRRDSDVMFEHRRGDG